MSTPSVEQARLQALDSLRVLDTPPESPLDDLTRLAAAICGTPIALISLVDAHRQWFKSRVGLTVSETPREVAFCAHAIREDGVFLVEDATADPRFASNPLVTGEPHVRFYAGAPLKTSDGHAIGTLCVIDRVPRGLAPQQREALRILGRQAILHLELRRAVAERDRALADREKAEDVLRTTTVTGRSAQPLPPARSPWPLVAAALLLPLALTLVATSVARERRARERLERFVRGSRALEGAVRERLARYEEILHGAQGLRAAGPVDRATWRRFASGLGLGRRPSGIDALGYVPYVPAAARPALEAAAVAERPGFAVTPPGARRDYLPVLYIDPEGDNARAVGHDLGTDPVSRAAAERARAEGAASISGRTTLVPGVEGRPGFLMFVPLVRGAHEPERPGAFDGWAFAVLRAEDVMGSVPPAASGELELEVYDAERPSPDALLYDSHPGPDRPADGLPAERRVSVLGRTWLLRFSPRPDLDAATPDRQPLLVLAGGAALSLLMAGTAWSLATGGQRAASLAAARTRELRESEERTRAVVDNVVDAILTWDEGGAIRSLNRPAERIFGYTPSEAIGRPIEQLIPASRGDLADGARNESEARRRDGTTFPVDLAVSQMVQDGRRLFVAVARDVSERRLAEQALRESEERTRSIVDNMLAGLLTVDEHGIVDQANPAALRMFGYALHELVGCRYSVLFPEGAAPRRAAFEPLLGRVSEWEARRRDGTVFPIELSLFAFRAGGRRHYAGSLRDLSERREVERMKSEFVSTVSHELRTPLTSIRGSLSLLSAGVLGDLGPEAKEAVEIAERNSARLLSLINDLLDLERLDHGRLEMTFAAQEAPSLVARALESVRGMADQQGVPLRAGAAEGTAWGDADRLVQVLVNLLSNAVKFSPAGRPVQIAASAEGRAVVFTVRDGGRGIPPEHLERIFERFSQVEASDARQKDGTGLGLSICRAIVEQHGGSLTVQSTVGEGSTFTVRVPAAGEKGAA